MKITGFYCIKPSHKEKLQTAATLAVVLMMSLAGDPAEASQPVAKVDIANKVARASEPIKQLLLGLADPVCYIVFAWGLLECMLGKAASGISRMKFATLGYLGMYWIPTFMTILRGARP